MRSLLRVFVVPFVTLLYFPGCAAMVRYESPSLTNLPPATTTTVHSMSFLWGIVPPQKISLEQCGMAGIQKMKVKQGLIDDIITWGTAGIVISYKVKLTCAAPQTAGQMAVPTATLVPAAVPAAPAAGTSNP